MILGTETRCDTIRPRKSGVKEKEKIWGGGAKNGLNDGGVPSVRQLIQAWTKSLGCHVLDSMICRSDDKTLL